MAGPSAGVVVVVAVAVVLDSQRAVIQYIDSSAGKQVGILEGRTAFLARIIGLPDRHTAVGIVFVALANTCVRTLARVQIDQGIESAGTCSSAI